MLLETRDLLHVMPDAGEQWVHPPSDGKDVGSTRKRTLVSNGMGTYLLFKIQVDFTLLSIF